MGDVKVGQKEMTLEQLSSLSDEEFEKIVDEQQVATYGESLPKYKRPREIRTPPQEEDFFGAYPVVKSTKSKGWWKKDGKKDGKEDGKKREFDDVEWDDALWYTGKWTSGIPPALQRNTVTLMPASIYVEVMAWAQAWHPYESCGLIAANDAGELVKWFPCMNIDPSPGGLFDMDPTEVAVAQFECLEKGWHLDDGGAVLFHTHPNMTAYPSGIDVSKARQYPNSVWVIAESLPHGILGMRAYQILDGGIHEEEISVVA